MHGALGPDGQLYQAFPLGGRVAAIDLDGGVWHDMTAEQGDKLVLIRVPLGSKRVLLRSSTDDLSGVVASPFQVPSSWPLDNLIQPFSVDRDRDDGIRFFLTVDPTDDGDGTDPVTVNVMFGG